jgi:serine protease
VTLHLPSRRLGALTVIAATGVAMALSAGPGRASISRPPAALDVFARPTPAYVPGRVIVGYRPGVRAGTAARIARSTGGRSAGAAPDTRALRLRPGITVTTALRRLRREPGVAFAQPDFIAHAAGQTDWFPNDRGPTGRYGGWESIQWNFMPQAGVNAPEAWANLRGVRKPGGKGAVVAILDTGVAYRNWHSFRRSPDFAHTRFVAPYDFVAGNHYPLDRNGHGTFVAGVVGESTNNIFGLTGIAYGATIMPLRVLDQSGAGDEETIAKAIRYAVDHGANVVNLSLEFSPDQVSSAAEIPDIASAIAFAHRRKVAVVAAAGNDETDQLAYPARDRGVISVGATTRDRCVAGGRRRHVRLLDADLPSESGPVLDQPAHSHQSAPLAPVRLPGRCDRHLDVRSGGVRDGGAGDRQRGGRATPDTRPAPQTARGHRLAAR